MADSRELQYKVSMPTDDAVNGMQGLLNELNDIKGAADEVERAGSQIGTEIEAGAKVAEAGVDKLGSALGDVKDNADELDKAIGKKSKNFFGTFIKGARDIGTAIKHPIKTIKEKFGTSLDDAGAKTDELGAKAKKTGEEAEGMGDKGSEAGTQIKDAIKGALGAFIGFEAIKQGIELLKSFTASALEAAGAAENIGAKFEASFAGTNAAEWVESYGTAVHRSKSEIESFLVNNKAMYGEMQITGDAALELSKVTTSLAYDFGNAFKMADADALSLIQDYIGGNTAAMEEYGIHIDDVALKNTALSMGLGSQIDSLDDAAMAQVRLNTLLDNTSGIQKAAINNTGGLTNSMKSLKGIWGNFMSDAGAKFTPTLEKLFGTIMDAWPTIEPMLLSFVETLSSGLDEILPPILDLGTTLVPTLTSVLGTLFEAATPLISVLAEIGQVILPPLANIIGTLGETLIPPLSSILETLFTSVIEPLMPVIESIASAILPPIASLLEEISPLLEGMAPIIGIIGDALSWVAEGIGKIVEFVGGGVGKVVGFFADLLGGAEDNEEAITVGCDNVRDVTDDNFDYMGTTATDTYDCMKDDADEAWNKMALSSDEATRKILNNLNDISRASTGAITGNYNIGANIPHNARGNDNFEGGFTFMNEEGGELAIMPKGSVIIPADKSQQLINKSTVNNSNSSFTVQPQVTININGNVDMSMVEQIKQCMDQYFNEFYRKAQEEDYQARAMQQAY